MLAARIPSASTASASEAPDSVPEASEVLLDPFSDLESAAVLLECRG